MKILDRFRLLRKRERIFLSIMKQRLYFETFFLSFLLLVMVGCDIPAPPTPTPPPPSPPPVVKTYEDGEFPYWLQKLCDTETGNLIYFSAYRSDGGIAVHPGGCKKEEK